MTQDFFTAGELAEVAKARGITSFPASERGVQIFAKREGWNDLPENLCRKRWRVGGGIEYHLSLLPTAMQVVLAARSIMAVTSQALGAREAAERRQIAALRTSNLSARARMVMEARAEILTSIEGYAISQGQTRAWGIAQFLDAQNAVATRQEIEERRDRGAILTPHEAHQLLKPVVLTAADGFHLTLERLALANDRRASPAVKRSAVYEWFKARDDRGVAALAPNPPTEAQPVPPEFGTFLKYYAVPSKPSVADAHVQYMKDHGADALSLAQVRRILRDRMNNIEKNVGREGLLTLRSRMSYVTRTTDGMWPTTIYTADGKTFDAEVADPVSRNPMRPEITSVLDVATRKCVGYAVSRKENTIAVTEGLRRSCVTHGIPAIFYTDRGAGYKNKKMDADVGGLMGRLGITKMHALPYNSQAKGIIERFNHVWNDLAKRMPTYIGRDMDKEAKKAIHHETRREIEEFGTARRLPTWQEFIQAVEETITAYNDRPHTGLPRYEDPQTGRLRHMTPNEAWESHRVDGFEAIMVDPQEEDDLFRPYEERKVQRGLVQWNTNEYFHPSLEAYHGETVVVGYDLHQADKVWVRRFDVTTGQPGALICVAIFAGNAERYVPLTAERKAVEDRNKMAIKRIDRRRRDKEAELDTHPLLEHQPTEPASFIDAVPAPEPQQVVLAVDNAPNAPTPPRRRGFATDEELAAWALEHPDELIPTQIAVLRRCLSRPIARESLRLSGIDTEALRTLLRAVAA